MTNAQSIRLLLFGLILSLSVSSYLFSLHLFFLLDRFAKDIAEVEATWSLIRQSLVLGSVLLVISLLVMEQKEVARG